ncbi:hypothetical protein HNY73_014253 [Argiope bruennichi]|uniref:Uncharacterized protein n=1 Tax=Argiope bruennichi TaxID=94029 RepID=A0A8T0ESQ0_ARGBR|nr:hypothetical protein HNY73_014253 [Argiope bruennichi]
MLFVWITVGALQATLGSKLGLNYLIYDDSIPELGSPCFPGTPCISPWQVFHPPESQLKYSTRPPKVIFKKSTSTDLCINNFVSTFQEEVKSSKILSDFFDSFDDVPAMEFGNRLYPEIIDSLTQVKTPNPEFVAQQAIEAVVENYDKLSSDIVIQIYANTVAKYLFTQGVLTPQNYVQLAKNFAKMIEEAAVGNDSPYAAHDEGFVRFLDSFGLFTPDKALLVAVQYGNEWEMAAKPKRG